MSRRPLHVVSTLSTLAAAVAAISLAVRPGIAVAQSCTSDSEDPTGAQVCLDPPPPPGGGGGPPSSDPEAPPVEADVGDGTGESLGKSLSHAVNVVVTAAVVEPPKVVEEISKAVGDAEGRARQEQIGSAVATHIAEVAAGSAFPVAPVPCVGPGGCGVVPTDQGGPRPDNASDHIVDGVDLGTDPVNLANGELVAREVDLAFPGFGVPFQHVRTYRSRIDFYGPLGAAWDHSYNQRLVALDSADCSGDMVLSTGAGSRVRFRRSGSTETEVSYASPPGVYRTLRKHLTGNTPYWTLTDPSGIVSTFDRLGLLTRVEDQNGYGLTLEWEPSSQYAGWRLGRVIDGVGRVIGYEYDSNERLLRVVEPASGLSASYDYDFNGDLVYATNAHGGSTKYEYAGGWPLEDDGSVPEEYLRSGCELACAPSGSSCDAGGACDDAYDSGGAFCRSQCAECASECSLHCGDFCNGTLPPGFVVDPSLPAGSDPVGAACAAGNASEDGCTTKCENKCVEMAPTWCATALDAPIGPGGSSPRQLCDDYCPASCVDACGFMDSDIPPHTPPAGSERCYYCCLNGKPGCFGSCQENVSCESQCVNTFLGEPTGTTCGMAGEEDGCPAQLASQCSAQCEPTCLGGCRDLCISNCGQGCHDGCNVDGCDDYCDSINYGVMCQTGCVDACIDAYRAPEGPRYGYLRDLNHNLVRAYLADGTKYLENEYGTDPARPDFDRVIWQQVGDGSVNLEYRDLIAEDRGDIAPPSTGPSAELALSRQAFEPVTLCPEPCGDVIVIDELAEYVPWRNTLLALNAAPNGLGGYPVSRQVAGSEVPPAVLSLSDVGDDVVGTPLSAQTVLPSDLSFYLMFAGERVRAVADTTTGSLVFSGSASATHELRSVGEITILTDSQGRVRVYPGQPVALHHVPVGRCTEPFRATAVDDGRVELSPDGACSSDVSVAPLASVVRDATIADALRAGDRVSISELDLFTASLMVPGRYTVRWTRQANSGAYARAAGADNGAAPPDNALSGFGASDAAPLLRAPESGDDAGRPIFVFHIVGEQRPAMVSPNQDDSGPVPPPGPEFTPPVLDMPGQFDPNVGDGCVAQPGVPIRGIGERPAWATTVFDWHGVPWTYYYDERLQKLRSVNHDTTAERSFEYDANGNTIGAEGPLRNHVCVRYDARGNPVEITRYPVPDAMGDAAPIVQRFAYEDFPARVLTASDPRDPSRILLTYSWDSRGNLTAQQNAVGDVTEYTPAPWGAPERITSPGGAVTEIDYDTAVGVVRQTIVDATGPDPVISYIESDPAGRPLHAIGPLGGQTTWSWSGPLLSHVRRFGGVLDETTQYSYDDNARVREIQVGDAAVSFTYDSLGFIRTTTDRALDYSTWPRTRCELTVPGPRTLESASAEGKRARYSYDGEGRITQVLLGALDPSAEAWDDSCSTVTDPEDAASGVVREIEYDLAGRPTVTRDARGNETRVDYDGFGRAIVVTDPSGATRRAGYDALGNVVWLSVLSTDAAGAPYRAPVVGDVGLEYAEQRLYDDAGRLAVHDVWHLDDSGVAVGDGTRRSEYAYDAAARTVTTVNDEGGTTVVRFDGAGRAIETILPTGDTLAVAHSGGGTRVEQTQTAPTADGLVATTAVLTPWGAVDRVESSEAGATAVLAQNSFDSRGRLIEAVAASGQVTSLNYDAFGRLTDRTVNFGEGVDELLTLVWSRDDELLSRISKTGGRSSVTNYRYDALGRLTLRTRPEGHSESWSYVGASSLVNTLRDARNVTFHHAYGPRGELQSLLAMNSFGGTQHRTFDYDTMGRLISATAAASVYGPSDDVTTTLSWDSLGNRTHEWDTHLGPSRAVTHVHDGLSRTRSSAVAGMAVTRDYDALGRLVDVFTGSTTTPLAHFDYAGLGGPVARTYGSGVTASYFYDAFGRLDGIVEDGPGGGPLAQWRWEMPLDGAPRLAGLRREGGAERASLFQVDVAGRVLYEEQGAEGVESFALAPDMSTSSTALAVGGFTGGGFDWRTYALDGRHNWLARTASDAALDTSPTVNGLDAYQSFAGAFATYDDAGALTALGDEAYEWDLFGALASATSSDFDIELEYDALGRPIAKRDHVTGEVTRYGYDGAARTIRELPDGRLEVTVEGQGVDEHLATIRTGSRGAEAFFYHQDRSRSVYLVTDEAGAPIEWNDYTAFGERTVTSPIGDPLFASLVDNRFGYHGQPTDLVPGLVHMRARWYRPDWGRFVSIDPIGFAGGANLYGFVNGAPLTGWDPSGLDPNALGQPGQLERINGNLFIAHGSDRFIWYTSPNAPARMRRFPRQVTREAFENTRQLNIQRENWTPAQRRRADMPLGALSTAVKLYGIGAGMGATGGAISVWGVSGTAVFAGKEGAEYIIEEVTGIPIINGPEDIVEFGAKRLDDAVEVVDHVGDSSRRVTRAGDASTERIDAPGASTDRRGVGPTANPNPPTIPTHATSTLEHVRVTGRAPPGYRGGRVFRNDGRGGGHVLPRTTPSGDAITYREFDVHPHTPGVNRGAERIVVGSDGRAWYTDDHYISFLEI